jgi:hypothetical protein
LLSVGFALEREDGGTAELLGFPNRLPADAPVAGVLFEEPLPKLENRLPPVAGWLPRAENKPPVAGFAALVGGAPAGVVELMAPKESGLAGVVAVLAPVVGALRLADPNEGAFEPGLAVLSENPVFCEVGVPAADVLLLNRPPAGNAAVVVDVVLALVEVGVELVFPKREPVVNAGLLAPPNKVLLLEVGCELTPPNNPPVEADCALFPPNRPPDPPPGVVDPEVAPVVAGGPPKTDFCSVGLGAVLPNKPPPVAIEGVEVLLLLLPPPKGKLGVPAAC